MAPIPDWFSLIFLFLLLAMYLMEFEVVPIHFSDFVLKSIVGAVCRMLYSNGLGLTPGHLLGEDTFA